MPANQMRAAVAVGLRMHEQHCLALCSRQGIVAGQRTHLAVEHYMRRDQPVHHLQRVRIAFTRIREPHIGAVLAARDVEVILADIVYPVIADRLAQMVAQTVARQHHDAARHARDDMPRDHRTSRRAVIDKHPRPGRLEPQDRLFAGIDQRQRPAAQRASGRVEINVVLQHVFGRVEQRQFDIIAFMHHHHRARDRTVIGEGLQPGILIDLNLFLDDRHFEFDDFGPGRGHLFMRMHEGGRHQFHLAARQCRQIGRYRPTVGRCLLGIGGPDHQRGHGRKGRPHQSCTSRKHRFLLLGALRFLNR